MLSVILPLKLPNVNFDMQQFSQKLTEFINLFNQNGLNNVTYYDSHEDFAYDTSSSAGYCTINAISMVGRAKRLIQEEDNISIEVIITKDDLKEVIEKINCIHVRCLMQRGEGTKMEVTNIIAFDIMRPKELYTKETRDLT